MPKEITLPKLSEDVDEGKVAEVLVKEGDSIEKDDDIITVESDKATVEVPSPEAGIVKEIKVSEGDSIKTGDVILLLEDEDEDEDEDEESDKKEKEEKEDEDKESEESEESEKSDESEEEEKGTQKKKEEDTEDEKKDKDKESEESEEPEKPDESEEEKDTEDEKENKDKEHEESEESEKIDEKEKEDTPAAPGAKRLARKHDIDLKGIKGSGPDGLITVKDVRKKAGLAGETEAQRTELPDFGKWGQVERQPLSEIRKVTAKQTQMSWQTIPHVTQFGEADVSEIQKYIEEHQEEAKNKGGKLTVTAILTKLIAVALHQFPKFNASIDLKSEEAILKKYIHIGIAVDTDNGLLVPVVRDVDQKSVIELSVEISKLAEKARNGELSGEEMEGGNFIISNLGGIGGTQFTPVIYHPQVAILGVSEMKTQPVFKDGSFHPVKMIPLSLSYDHRLIDGAEGAKFLKYICDALEDPYKAMLGS